MRHKCVNVYNILVFTMLAISLKPLPLEWNIFANQLLPQKQKEELRLETITEALTNLGQKQREIYNEHLSLTRQTYQCLEGLLGIVAANEELPIKYLSLKDINIQTKRKIVIDLALERLRKNEKGFLADNEREALKIDQHKLRPSREISMNKLNTALQVFTTTIRRTLKHKDPLSISSDGNNFRALFLLDKESINPH